MTSKFVNSRNVHNFSSVAKLVYFTVNQSGSDPENRVDDSVEAVTHQGGCALCARYWMPQKLPQIYTVIAYICIGKVA